MKTLNINHPVSVIRMSFGRDMRVYPRAILYNGTEYEFVDRGLSYSVKRGGQVTFFLALSDGIRDFWLRDGGNGNWTLLGMSG